MPPLFFPPEPNRFVIGVTHVLGPILARLLYKITLHISPEDLARLRRLSHQRVIYLVNHPSFNDPIPVMLLSAKLQKSFYYLASVEQFAGLLGRYFQKIGTYSVRRGQRDRPSIKQTLALLGQPETHLVIFPEGGCSFQNDTVMPFRPGAIQLAFQAMQRQLKQGQPVMDCYIVPLALKYQYRDDLTPVILRMFRDLEQELGLVSDEEQSGIERLRAIASQVRTNIEVDYGFEPFTGDENGMQTLQALRYQILEACEAALGIVANENAPVRERTYQLEVGLDQLQGEPCGMSRALISRSVSRLFNFNAIYEGYVADKPTPERFLDTLTRLEREVFEIDRPKVKGPRVAQIAVGDCFNLKEYYSAYEQDRGSTIDELTLKAQDSVQSQIDRLSDGATYLKI